jgi:alanine dehydrogenase
VSPYPTRILSRRDVEAVLTMADALEVVAEAFAAHGRGDARMPPKVYLDLPEHEGDFRAMPAYVSGGKAASLKWVNSHPRNPARGLPAVMGVLILSDPETALPRAVMDATLITAVRTGAAGGVAARVLARPESEVLALIGAGVQARWQLEALLPSFELREIRLADPSTEAIAGLRDAFPALRKRMRACGTAREGVDGADLVVTTTPCREPVIEAGWVASGTHVNAIGADAPGKQELATGLVEACTIVVDDPVQARHSGEVNVPLSTGSLEPARAERSLGQVLAGLAPGRGDPEEITLFDSTGLAVQDLAVAEVVAARAEDADLGLLVDLVGV